MVLSHSKRFWPNGGWVGFRLGGRALVRSPAPSCTSALHLTFSSSHIIISFRCVPGADASSSGAAAALPPPRGCVPMGLLAAGDNDAGCAASGACTWPHLPAPKQNASGFLALSV